MCSVNLPLGGAKACQPTLLIPRVQVLGIRHAVEAGGSRCGICNGADWRTLRAAELRGQATSLLTSLLSYSVIYYTYFLTTDALACSIAQLRGL